MFVAPLMVVCTLPPPRFYTAAVKEIAARLSVYMCYSRSSHLKNSHGVDYQKHKQHPLCATRPHR